MADNLSGTAPGAKVGGPDRRTAEGGAVVDGFYIPPGTFGGAPATSPTPVAPPGTLTPMPFPTSGAGDMCFGVAKPTAGLRPGYEWYCNQETRQWDTRWVGSGPEPKGPNEQGQDPLTNPTVKPGGAPTGYDYQWSGTSWKLVKVATGTAPGSMTREESQNSAKSIIAETLRNYGLEALTGFVNDIIFKEDIISEAVILGRIRETETYKTRFAGNAARRSAGLNALSEGDYVRMENTYRQLMRAAGIPANFYDQPSDLATLIGGDVSGAELASRINDGYLAVQQANPQVIAELKRLYPVGDAELAMYFLDPQKATPILLRQARSAQIAAEATLQAQRQLSAAEAEQLSVAGITPEQARQGFQTIAAAEQLFVPLPGTTEQAISQQEQMAGVFGTEAAAQQRIRQRARERAAAFEAGGRFAGQGTTVSGLQ